MRARGVQTSEENHAIQGHSLKGHAMKRMHVHVSVENIDKAVSFYSALFAAQPSVTKPDYAKWMLDDPRVKALGKVKTAIELGGYVGIGKTGVITSPYDKLSVSLSYRHDVAGAHDSGIWQPSINYLTPLSTKAAVGLFATAEHAGRGYATSYFSISPTQAIASGLPTYNARGGWKNYSIGGLATYSLTGNLLHGWKVVAGGTYRRMLNDFGDSPVVSIAGSRNQWLGAVGVAYTF